MVIKISNTNKKIFGKLFLEDQKEKDLGVTIINDTEYAKQRLAALIK